MIALRVRYFIRITEYDLTPGKSLIRGRVTILKTETNTPLNTEEQWQLRYVKKARRTGLKNIIFFLSAIGMTSAPQEIVE